MFAISEFGSSTNQNQYNTYDSWKTRVRSYPLACICHKLTLPSRALEETIAKKRNTQQLAI